MLYDVLLGWFPYLTLFYQLLHHENRTQSKDKKQPKQTVQASIELWRDGTSKKGENLSNISLIVFIAS